MAQTLMKLVAADGNVFVRQRHLSGRRRKIVIFLRKKNSSGDGAGIWLPVAKDAMQGTKGSCAGVSGGVFARGWRADAMHGRK
jgi:hypothetical protein